LAAPLPAAAQFFNRALADPVVTFNVDLNEATSATRRDLERAEAFLKNEQWDEGIETFRRILEEDSERVIAASDLGHEAAPYAVYIPVREYCQMRLARLADEAPAALALYRQRVDPVAQGWLREAQEENDLGLLERIVRTALASSFGDDALLLLGELEMERGNLAAARGCWERISPLLRTPASPGATLLSPPSRPLWLALQGVDLQEHGDEIAAALEQPAGAGAWFVYPDTDLDLADVRARLVLVSILEGSPDRAAVELTLFARLHPDAQGVLGGRRGLYHELLSALLEQSRQWPDVPPSPDWPTFAGSQERHAAAASEVDVAGRPLWVREFDQTFIAGGETAEDRFFQFAPAPGDSEQQPPTPLLSYHPVIVGDVVLYNDWRQIYALHLRTGEPAWPLGSGDESAGAIYQPPLPFLAFDSSIGRRELGAPRFTLNVQNDRLMARMGSPVTGEPPGGLGSSNQGYLVGLDLKTLKKLHGDIGPEAAGWAFEGTPVTDGARLYVAMRQSEIRAVAYVACYDLQTGRQVWRRKICSAETFGQGQRREMTHNLLTLAEGTLYYNTNLGAIAAIAVPDGELKWVARYPRVTRRRDQERQDPRFLRDLNPCVVHKGIVLAFPADCNQIFALDAMSGQFLWATPEESTPDVSHLLGVAGDTLIAGGANLYWLNAYSGRFLAQFPENGSFSEESGLPDPHGAGRGVLAGGVVYWPTQANTDAASETHGLQIQVFRQQLRRTERAWQVERVREIDLSTRVPGIPLDGANLVIGNGVLLLATPRHLIAFGE
jgi:outer membrane protein assembly factor BamB